IGQGVQERRDLQIGKACVHGHLGFSNQFAFTMRCSAISRRTNTQIVLVATTGGCLQQNRQVSDLGDYILK
ncbi:MAG TPA: hypothetical protein VEL70_08550, partial [Candidatus Acidoferrum sp.]|nr:hypothetical protein [Candidatus Acidoferrum sp.]